MKILSFMIGMFLTANMYGQHVFGQMKWIYNHFREVTYTHL